MIFPPLQGEGQGGGGGKIRHRIYEIQHLAVRPEPFDLPFALSLSKGERFPQDRLVEGRARSRHSLSGERDRRDG